jgi:hypothetical protein
MATKAIILSACVLMLTGACLAQAEVSNEPAKAEASKADMAAVVVMSRTAVAMPEEPKVFKADGALLG